MRQFSTPHRLTPNSAYPEAHSLSELSSIHYQINSEVREMVVIKIIFIIFWGAFMLVPLFARDAEVQDHLDRHGHLEAESDE